jgi:hypothetical protein
MTLSELEMKDHSGLIKWSIMNSVMNDYERANVRSMWSTMDFVMNCHESSHNGSPRCKFVNKTDDAIQAKSAHPLHVIN